MGFPRLQAREDVNYAAVVERIVLSSAAFVVGLVLFVGGVNAVRPPEQYGERPSRLFDVGAQDSALRYVQTDGAILGSVGLFAMLAATLV